MKTASTRLTRREVLARAVVAGTAGFVRPSGLLAGSAEGKARLAFFVVGDTHYLADRKMLTRMDAASSDICGRVVDTLNRLPGEEIPAEAGGGRVLDPLGVIHVGDVIDTGDKQGGVTREMQKTEWAAFTDDYGLNGQDGRLKFPVYEVHGNHDSPHGTGHAIEKIVQRNRKRPGLVNVSANGLHYSWDWEHVHFVNLGLIVGNDPSVERKRRYAALGSLDFLVDDLREKVGSSGRPVVITHHVDIARYTVPCEPQAPADGKEWDPCDVQAYHRALDGFNVAAIFYGHTHTRRVFQWDGTSDKAARGIHVFNADNASHFGGDKQAVFYVEMSDKQLVVREYQTEDRWQSGFFTPQTWTAPVAQPGRSRN